MRSRDSRPGSGAFVLLAVGLVAAPAPLRAAVAAIGVAVKVDQAGYLPAARKVAIVVTASPVTTFSVKSQIDGAVALKGPLGPHTDDVDSVDSVQAADFSALQKPGRYFVEVEGVGRRPAASQGCGGGHLGATTPLMIPETGKSSDVPRPISGNAGWEPSGGRNSNTNSGGCPGGSAGPGTAFPGEDEHVLGR